MAMYCHLRSFTQITASLLFFQTANLLAQEPAPAKTPVPAAIVIADEPRTIDPASLLPEKLSAKVTVDFSNKSLKDLVTWFRVEQKLDILLNEKAISQKNILISEQVDDRLENQPVYLVLNRLQTIGLSWYLKDGNIHLTTLSEADEHKSTVPNNVGDLLDAGYLPEVLPDTISRCVDGDWAESSGGGGTVDLLGDVLFVRQTDTVHRKVAGLLSALRKPARQTFALDPPENEAIRTALHAPLSVSFQDTPLVGALATIAKQAKVDIRLNKTALANSKVRDRVPVTLELADQQLSTVLQTMLDNLNLTWVLQDGVLWVTSQEAAKAEHKTAVYDVRNLCSTLEECDALASAIQNQSHGSWDTSDGTLSFPKPGILVAYHTEPCLNELSQLLNNYRLALKESKPRKRRDKLDPKEVITQYYRVPSVMVEDVEMALPELLPQFGWKSKANAQGIGTISHIRSKPELIFAESGVYPSKDNDKEVTTAVVPHSVLIIKQTREAHAEISTLLDRLLDGDNPETGAAGGMGGMGGAMPAGSFGGGLFSLPDSPSNARSKK